MVINHIATSELNMRLSIAIKDAGIIQRVAIGMAKKFVKTEVKLISPKNHQVTGAAPKDAPKLLKIDLMTEFIK
jgi:hypothetical protein